MTEASYQQARVLMRQLNYLRGLITAQKGEVAKWTAIEAHNLENGKSTNAVRARIEKEIQKLDKLRGQFAAIQFPPADLPNTKKDAQFCRICQTEIEKHLEYCIDCDQNKNIPKYDFKNRPDKEVSE